MTKDIKLLKSGLVDRVDNAVITTGSRLATRFRPMERLGLVMKLITNLIIYKMTNALELNLMDVGDYKRAYPVPE